MHHFWILLIKILVLEFDAFKGIAISAGFPLPPSAVHLISIDTSTLRLLWSSPNTTNETLLGFNITWDENWTYVDNSSRAFDIMNLPTPGKNYTAIICAYYATQQNSEYISVSNNTYPSPASNITVVSRQMDRFDLNWTNEGVSDNCFVWAEEAPNAITSCFTGSRTAVIANLPTPGQQYTIRIVIQSDQLNSTTSTITERTNPSPASNITVVSRQMSRFDLTWTNEGLSDNCFVWVEEAPNATTSCFTINKTAVITSLPTPGKLYTIHIVIGIGQLDSTTSTIIERTSPSQLQLTAAPMSPYSALINWTLSGDIMRTGPGTYYNLTITDIREPTIIINRLVAGYYNRSVVVSSLDEYWIYSVAIDAHIIDEYGEELTTEGAEVVYFQTLESTPGQVQSFNVSSLSNVQQCNASRVMWQVPVERDLNGNITGYVIRWQQVNGADHGITEVPAGQRETTVRVEPDDQRYNFTIQAKTKAGEGVARSQILLSTGYCYPVPVQNVSSVLMKPSSNDDADDDQLKTNSFFVNYDPNFFQDNGNGNITYSALLVREVPDSENITGITEFGNQSLYTNALTWSEAMKQKKIPEYRATADDWLSGSTSGTRKKRSYLQYLIGGNKACSKDSKVACNGPLPPDSAYQVRAMACTRQGCLKTEYSPDIYRTKKPASKAWIAAAVLVPIVCIVAAVLIVLYIRRRQKAGRKSSSVPPSSVPQKEVRKPSSEPHMEGKMPSSAPQIEVRMSSSVPQKEGRMPSAVPQKEGRMPSAVPQNEGMMPSSVPQMEGRMFSSVPQKEGRMPSAVPQKEGRMPSSVPQMEVRMSSSVVEHNVAYHENTVEVIRGNNEGEIYAIDADE